MNSAALRNSAPRAFPDRGEAKCFSARSRRPRRSRVFCRAKDFSRPPEGWRTPRPFGPVHARTSPLARSKRGHALARSLVSLRPLNLDLKGRRAMQSHALSLRPPATFRPGPAKPACRLRHTDRHDPAGISVRPSGTLREDSCRRDSVVPPTLHTTFRLLLLRESHRPHGGGIQTQRRTRMD